MHTPDWVKHAVFYQIFPDRFARSPRMDTFRANLHFEDWDTPPSIYGFKGGDLYGVAEHLDYLHDLGITALYLNPIFASASNHRYHTYDYYQVDPLLGGNQALRFLLDEAHRRGIRVVLDGVFNHASRGFWQFHHVLENGDGSPYLDWFHFDPARLRRERPWGAYPGETELEALRRGASAREALGYEAWWNLAALPKFNTQTPAVREFIFSVAEHWIRFGIDGWRLDVPAEIDDDTFWQTFRRRVKAVNPDAYIVGEIWHRADRWLQGDQFDAVMNYPLGEATICFFGGEHLNYEEIRKSGYGQRIQPIDGLTFLRRLQDDLSWYAPEITQAQLNLFDSHDTPRFLTAVGGDKSALKLAWLTLFTLPGAPSIYYGDEIGLEGGHDPYCRGSFPWNIDRWDNDLLAYLKTLIALRKAHTALRTGSFAPLHADANTAAWVRENDGTQLTIIVNAAREPRFMPLSDDYAQADVLFGNGQIRRQAQGLLLEISPRSGMVILK